MAPLRTVAAGLKSTPQCGFCFIALSGSLQGRDGAWIRALLPILDMNMRCSHLGPVRSLVEEVRSDRPGTAVIGRYHLRTPFLRAHSSIPCVAQIEDVDARVGWDQHTLRQPRGRSVTARLVLV